MSLSVSFEIDRDQLIAVLKDASAVVSAKPIQPALSLVKMRLRDAYTVEFVATDLLSVIWATAPCKSLLSVEDLEVLVDPKVLMKYARSLPDGAVTVTFDADSMQITSGKTTSVLAVAKASEFVTLPSLALLADVEWSEVPRGGFFSDLKSIREAVSTATETPQFCQAAVREGIWLAFDGTRVHAKPCSGYMVADFTIPYYGIRALYKTIDMQEYDTFGIALLDTAVVYRTPNLTVLVYNLKVAFAEVDGLLKVTSLSNSHAVQVERDDVLAALDRVKHTTGSTGAVRIEVTPNQMVFATSSPIGETAATVECTSEETQTLWVQTAHIREAFRALPAAAGIMYLGDHPNVKGAKEVSPVRVLTPPGIDKFTAVLSQLKKDVL